MNCSPTVRRILCILAGVLFGAAWWYFIDAIIYNAVISDRPRIQWYAYIAPVTVTISLIMINIIDPSKLYASPFTDEFNARVKAWLFVSFTLGFFSIASAISIFVVKYPSSEEVGILVQPIIVLLSAFLLLLARYDPDQIF
eukprot:TRINITY_DN15708_c0_g1_i1.p1 TRINITY_DN15708_c0_g1~~TRINITY_DN15708_c0_g1_i1.p1  ORF type:complete len:141 (-),score=3.58 TRINITY_DN15708_c0_g1_i1:59-481(-)